MLTPSKYWRESPQRYRLEAAKCTKCGKVFFPPRLVCDSCKNGEFEKTTLPDEGKIVSYSMIHVTASNFSDEAPIALGIIELDNGTKITAQVTDCTEDELAVGVPVKLEFRKVQEAGESGVLCYGYKAVLKR
ncbi:MAG: transcriptional regulator [Candidatus Latescibacteria bacterium]|nr:transcriptional regulator [Candidatus Latescibacterota bacterium]NIM21751.1 transcriptional regulator [Candidatus Latescibacterota bacterium]NIM65889.1 transcriptional regulator [Candidatus Latescibacterota bacterium]NIO02634.1 transcriptional regulator [Candidatus Latescibacterota bacterium]NIO29615.1 transcriptional regulator [Candidatus Latescibacterota bacterium]